MVDPSTLNLLLVAAVFGSVLGVFLYLKYRMRRRRAELTREPIPTREVLNDRAYNQIRLARSAAQRLERSGIDVAGIPQLLDRAEEARQRGDSETASAFAQSANESLKRLQTGAPTGVPAIARPPSGGPPPSTSGVDTPPGTPGGEDTPASRRRLPPNKAESHFQITLLGEDLQKGSGSPDAVRAAQVLMGDAQRAFDKGQYTEALRLGLKGRRMIGGRIDSLPASTGSDGTDSLPVPPTPTDAPPARCASCGQPLRPNDKFCRGCGAQQGASRCAQCGQALAAADVFCGACGAPVRS